MGAEIRQRLDQAFTQPVPVAERKIQESLEAREQSAARNLDQKVETRLNQRLTRDAQEHHADQSSPAAPSTSRSAPAAERAVAVARRKEAAQAFKDDPNAAPIRVSKKPKRHWKRSARVMPDHPEARR